MNFREKVSLYLFPSFLLVFLLFFLPLLEECVCERDRENLFSACLKIYRFEFLLRQNNNNNNNNNKNKISRFTDRTSREEEVDSTPKNLYKNN